MIDASMEQEATEELECRVCRCPEVDVYLQPNIALTWAFVLRFIQEPDRKLHAPCLCWYVFSFNMPRPSELACFIFNPVAVLSTFTKTAWNNGWTTVTRTIVNCESPPLGHKQTLTTITDLNCVSVRCPYQFLVTPQYADEAPPTLPKHEIFLVLVKKVLFTWLPFILRVIAVLGLWLCHAYRQILPKALPIVEALPIVKHCPSPKYCPSSKD
jgi:hypothetical protein